MSEGPAYAESATEMVINGETSVEVVLHPGVTLEGVVKHQITTNETKVSLFVHETYTQPAGIKPEKLAPSLPMVLHSTRFLMQVTSKTGGGFSFQRVRPGKYTILAQSAKGLVGIAKDIGLDASRPMPHVTIDLDEGAMASGQVIEFGSGKPLPGIQVFARLFDLHPPVADVTTNEAGQFTLTGLPLGVKLMIQSQSMGRFIDEISRVQFKDKGRHLSPAVALLRADQWEQLVDTNNNQGIFLVFDDGIPIIQHVKTDSAAAHAGLQKGDRLRKINGTVVDGLLSRGINTLLSGAPKTTVILEVIRRGSQLPTEITLVRR